MEDINGQILVKSKEVEVEKDAKKKALLQNQLQILQIRKQIIGLQQRIDNLRK